MCKVFGFYYETLGQTSRTVASPRITIQIRDNTCWIQRRTNFVGKAVQVGRHASECRQACRDSPVCSDYQVALDSNTLIPVCAFMTGVCIRGMCSILNEVVTTKVKGCSARSSCIHISDRGHAWIDGDYCPSGQSGGSTIYLKSGSTVPDTLYLAKWDVHRDTDIQCAALQYVLKQAAPGSDYEDADSSYLELKGASVKCVGGGDVDWLETIFAQGQAEWVVSSVDLWKSSRGTGSISATNCGAPNTTMTEDNQESKSAAVQVLVLDDPATSPKADY